MKILPIKKSADFRNLSKSGDKFFSKTVLLLSLPTAQPFLYDPTTNKNAKDFCRIGYTVSKTVGNAVARNLAKRRLREALAMLATSYSRNGYDYVIIARKEISKSDFSNILSDLKFCLKRIHSSTTSSGSKNRS